MAPVDPKCMVVVTRSVGREARSLVFRRWRYVDPIPTERSGSGSRRFISENPPARHISEIPPAAPSVGQIWRQVDPESAALRTRLEKMFLWNGAEWIGVRDQPTIVMQGKQPCGFMEALAWAHEMAKWGNEEVIYTYDESAWGNA